MKTTKILIAATLLSTVPCFAASNVTDAPRAERSEEASRQSIWTTASQSGQFQILTQLIREAGLERDLAGQGPFTLFAPTDEAFKQMPSEKLEQLKHDKNALRKFLQYHVVSGNVSASQVASRSEAKSLEGEPLRFSQKDGKVFVNDAEVVTPDIQAANGTIHAIDKVLMPND